MDVPYNKSGASSRGHYQLVRNVENALLDDDNDVEETLIKEVERIEGRIVRKMISTTDLRKDLIILLYCLNSSNGSITSTSLAFALPSAVHLAEAATKVSERWIGHLFCSEVMPKEHELQLMLVNTIRKDIYSASLSRIALALESLITSPSIDVIPSVHDRCLELLSHPSSRLKVLAMHALLSLSKLSPNILRNERFKSLLLKRLSDGEEVVVRSALKIGKELANIGTIAWNDLIPPSISLMSRFADKNTARLYSSACVLTVLRLLNNLLSIKEIQTRLDHVVPDILLLSFTILRRAVKYERHSIILESFRLLGAFPPTIVAKYITDKKSVSSEAIESSSSDNGTKSGEHSFNGVGALNKSHRKHFDHPVALIRHFLSSRVVNEHYLFLSCLAQLHPILWAGIGQTAQNSRTDILESGGDENVVPDISMIENVLDQWEVERVLSSLESDDEGIRKLTLQILGSLEPALLEGCFDRSLQVLQTFSDASPEKMNKRARQTTLTRALEIVHALSLGNTHLKLPGLSASGNKEKGKEKEKAGASDRAAAFAQRLQQVTEALGCHDRAEKTIVDYILCCVRKEESDIKRACILELLAVVDPVTVGTADLVSSDTNLDTSVDKKEKKKYDTTLLLAFLALLCEFASLFQSSLQDREEVTQLLYRLTSLIKDCSVLMQEPIILCMTRLVTLLPHKSQVTADSDQEALEQMLGLLNELEFVNQKLLDALEGAGTPVDKEGVIAKRYEQFNSVLKNKRILPDKKSLSLPEFALILDQMEEEEEIYYTPDLI